MRTYELMFVVDPRVADEEVASITEDVKGMVTAKGGHVIREEQWGRRRLGYEIGKLKEGKYVLLYLGGEATQVPVSQLEFRMGQNDRILRYMTVRTDEELRRAGLPLPTEAPPPTAEELAAAAAAGAAGATPAGSAAPAAPAEAAPAAPSEATPAAPAEAAPEAAPAEPVATAEAAPEAAPAAPDATAEAAPEPAPAETAAPDAADEGKE